MCVLPTQEKEPQSVVEVAIQSLHRVLVSEPSTAASATSATRAEWWAHARSLGSALSGSGQQQQHLVGVPEPGAVTGAHQLHFDVDETRLRKVQGDIGPLR